MNTCDDYNITIEKESNHIVINDYVSLKANIAFIVLI